MAMTIPDQISSLADILEAKTEFRESSQEQKFEQMVSLFRTTLERNGREHIENNAQTSQRINRYAIDTMVYIYETGEASGEKNDAYIKASNIMTTLQHLYPTEKWLPIRCGILAEVATTLALKEKGFVVIPPSTEDDLKGKVDMWAYDKGDTTLAIQVKSNASITMCFVKQIKTERDGKIHIGNEHREDAQTMLEYVSNRVTDGRIIPVFVEIPGGINNEFSGFHEITGAPSETLPDSLYDQIERKIFTKENGYD